MSYPEHNFDTRETVHPAFWCVAVAIPFWVLVIAVWLT